MQKRAIGIFDSGFGGLEIFREIIKVLPEYDYIYLGDSARAPYGDRTSKEILKFSIQALEFFVKNNCPLVIFACNTASSQALRIIQRKVIPGKHHMIKVLGVLIPAAEEAIQKTKNFRIGVIGTNRTIKSMAFVRELKKLNPEVEIFQKACPLLVPLIEKGENNSPRINFTLKRYLKNILDKNIDTLILGCTHYGIIEENIQKIIGRDIKIISQRKVVGQKLKEYFTKHPEIEKKLSRKSRTLFFTTGEVKKFKILGSRIYQQEIFPLRAKIN